MPGAHFRIEPAVHQLLQTRLAAKMFHCGVMRHHVFPRIDLEHLPFQGFGMGAVRLGPGQPPMINRTLLLAADIAIESFGPGHRRHPIQRSGFLHEGSLHRASGATRAILCHFAAQNQLKITKFHRRYGAGELLHSRPQESTEFLSIHSCKSNKAQLRLGSNHAGKTNF